MNGSGWLILNTCAHETRFSLHVLRFHGCRIRSTIVESTCHPVQSCDKQTRNHTMGTVQEHRRNEFGGEKLWILILDLFVRTIARCGSLSLSLDLHTPNWRRISFCGKCRWHLKSPLTRPSFSIFSIDVRWGSCVTTERQPNEFSAMLIYFLGITKKNAFKTKKMP